MKFYKIALFSFITLLFTSAFAEPYRKNVVVSYYAEDFHGKKTSNGETFSMYQLTCASKTLPFDTELKVTNLANGNSVIVRVNDRGPFVPNRELDLSKAAAIKLDMIKTGTAHVQIDIIKMGPNTKISQQTAASANKIMTQRYGANWNGSQKNTSSQGQKTVPNNTTAVKPQNSTQSGNKYAAQNKKTVDEASASAIFEIQVGSFSTKENAQKASKKLYDSGFRNIFIRSNGEIFRVVIKNVPKSGLQKINKDLQASGYNDFIIRVQK